MRMRGRLLSAAHRRSRQLRYDDRPSTQERHTQHTTFPVPCMVIDSDTWQLADGQGLSSVAPTVLQLLGIAQPVQMSGRSLLLAR